MILLRIISITTPVTSASSTSKSLIDKLGVQISNTVIYFNWDYNPMTGSEVQSNHFGSMCSLCSDKNCQ